MSVGDQVQQAAVTPPEQQRLRVISRSLASRLMREHPTLFLTASYLALAFVGLIYDWWFFIYFRINILDYSETSDFLLSALRNPLVILLSMLPVALIAIIVSLSDYSARRFRWYGRYSKKYDYKWWNRPVAKGVIYGLGILVYAFYFMQIYAKRTTDRIKEGRGTRVTFVRMDGATPGEKPMLLGSTNRFFFLYYPGRKATEIVPVENTSIISIDSRSRRERLRDSLQKGSESPD